MENGFHICKGSCSTRKLDNGVYLVELSLFRSTYSASSGVVFDGSAECGVFQSTRGQSRGAYFKAARMANVTSRIRLSEMRQQYVPHPRQHEVFLFHLESLMGETDDLFLAHLESMTCVGGVAIKPSCGSRPRLFAVKDCPCEPALFLPMHTWRLRASVTL